MKLLLILIVLTIFWCDATFVCRHYDESTKSLEIYCGHHEQQQQQLPQNCSREIPSLYLLGVIRLKIEGCYQSDGNEINIEKSDLFDVSYSGYRPVDWSIDVSESVTDFDASFNELTAVPTAILRKYPKLETLDLKYNSLAKISADDFKNGQKLQAIDLSHNMLEFIEANAFANLTDLLFIDLKDNQFLLMPVFNDLYASTIDMEENAQLTTFDCLSISTDHKSALFVRISWEYIKLFYGDSNCRQWKFNVHEMNDSQGVYTDYPPFDQIDLVFNEQFDVQYFVAGRQNFYNVTQMLNFIGSSVWKIDLTGNYVGRLDAISFQRFRFLRELILCDTGLTTIDINVLGNLKLLNRLDLSMNRLQTIENPILLQYFAHLIDFNVAGNCIENTDDIIRYLPSTVHRLNFSGNNVSLANDFHRFARFATLKYLNLSNTNLLILDAYSFKSFRHLTILDVSHNNLSAANFVSILSAAERLKEFRAADSQITNVSEIIEHLGSSVEVLDLSGSAIGSSIRASLIQRLGNLTHLNLSGTHLRSFDLESLKTLRQFHTLDISHNQLQSIDLKELPKFTQLHHLYLNDNDLTKLDNFDLTASPNVLLAIGRNNMPCAYLRQLNYENPNLKYVDNRLDQKHGMDCQANTQAIGDFLDKVYEKVKFW